MVLATVHSHETRDFIYSPVPSMATNPDSRDVIINAGIQDNPKAVVAVLEKGQCSLSEALLKYAAGSRQRKSRARQNRRNHENAELEAIL